MTAMKKTAAVLAFVACVVFTASASSPPPAPVVYILQPGDDLPMYDGELDRVVFQAVEGSFGSTKYTFWPAEGLYEYRIAAAFKHRFTIHSPDIPHWTGEGDLKLWDGGGQTWWEFTVISNIWGWPLVIDAPHQVPPFEGSPPYTVFVSTVAHDWHLDGWTDYFEGTGIVHLDWQYQPRGQLRYRPGNQRMTPTMEHDLNLAVRVTYYPR